MIPEDTLVTCPGCGRSLFKFKRDIHSGDIVTAGDLSPLGSSPKSAPRDPGLCPYCHDRWLTLPNGVHTATGWKKIGEK